MTTDRVALYLWPSNVEPSFQMPSFCVCINDGHSKIKQTVQNLRLDVSLLLQHLDVLLQMLVQQSVSDHTLDHNSTECHKVSVLSCPAYVPDVV